MFETAGVPTKEVRRQAKNLTNLWRSLAPTGTRFLSRREARVIVMASGRVLSFSTVERRQGEHPRSRVAGGGKKSTRKTGAATARVFLWSQR